jgi:hypothetical protein
MKAPVKRFRIGGRLRPVRFSYNAIAQFEDRTGRSVIGSGDEDVQLGVRGMRALLYCGLEDGARKEGDAFMGADGQQRATLWDAGEWLMEMSDRQKEQVFEFFETSAQGLGDEESPAAAREDGSAGPTQADPTQAGEAA